MLHKGFLVSLSKHNLCELQNIAQHFDRKNGDISAVYYLQFTFLVTETTDNSSEILVDFKVANFDCILLHVSALLD